MTKRVKAIGTSVLVAAAVGLVAPPASGQGSAPPDRASTLLEVDVAKPFKPVDHAASGGLYGLADEGWPADRWIAPIRPTMFTQPPPGATHQPNGEPAPVGDTLDVWRAARRNGATVTVRLPDIFPTFPYQWQGDDFWYAQVERIVRATIASGADNIYGYEIWNEPQWTWNPAWGDFDEMWARTHRLIRGIDPHTPIIGPSHDRDYENGLRQFLTAAKASGTVPDIISWHELGTDRGIDIEARVLRYREIERDLGIGPLPISINEYGAPRDAGVPGWLTRFVARLERAEVDTANLAFWHKPGRLSDLLVPVGGGSGPARDAQPTGNYSLFKWYGEMTGNMVETTPPSRAGRYVPIGDPVTAPSTRVPGRAGFGNAITLNGADANRFVALPPGILRGITDFTVATWVDITDPATWSRIFDFGTGTGTYMFLTPRSGDDTVRFAITNGGGAEQRIDGATPLPTGWTHVAVTKSGTVGTLYVNGRAVATNPRLTLGPSDLDGGDTPNNWIGRSQFADPLLAATVDDFHLFDRALTATEVLSLQASPGGDTGGGNVGWYRFDESGGTAAADSSGRERHATITTRVDVPRVPALDGLASADPSTRTVRVIFGGGDGDVQLKVGGLTALPRFGKKARVQILATEWTGTDGVANDPATLFDGTYPVRDGAISVPVSGIEDSTAYLAVIRPEPRAAPTGEPDRRHEAETAHHTGRRTVVVDPLASENRYVRAENLAFSVTAPNAGAYDLDIRYTNPTPEPARGSVTVNGKPHPVQFAPTAALRTVRLHVTLDQGHNRIGVRPGSSELGVDHIDVTPFRTRVEAETGQWSGAHLVVVDMDDGNFFAPYVSNDAYVADLSQEDSNLRLPVTVPSTGRYRLSIGYSTAGAEEERRAQIKSGHLLRVNDGPWQQVSYDPTQFRQMIRQTAAVVDLPAGTSTLTFAKSDPNQPGQPRPGVVDLDYVDVIASP